MRKFTFFLKQQDYHQELDLTQLSQLAENIRNTLFSCEKYQIQSDVDIENFKAFINYFVDKTKPFAVTTSNIYDFRQLSDEFQIMQDYLSSTDFDSMYQISVLKNTKTQAIQDRSSFEEYISQNLDTFIDNFSEDLYQIPITSLFNIFYNKKRKLTDQEKAYHFITNHEANQELFILLNSLDFNFLSKKTVEEAISMKNDRFGFCPTFSIDQIMISKQKSLKEKIPKLNELENKIIYKEAKLKEKDKLLSVHQQILKEQERKIQTLILQSKEKDKSLSEHQQILKEQENKIQSLIL